MTWSIVLLLLVCALLPASVVSITEDEAIAQDNNERLVWTCCVILKKDAWKNTDCTDKLCSDFVKELPKPKDTKDKEYVKLKRAVMSLKTKELLEGAQKEFKSLAEKLTKPDPIKDLQETGRGEINLWIEESKRQNAKKPDDWEDKPSPPIEQKEQSKLQGEQLSAQLASKSGGAAANVKLVIPTLVETEMAQLADGMESSQRHQLSKGKVKQRMQAKQAAWQSSASGNPFVTGNRLHPRGIVKYDFDQTVVPSQGVPSATQIAYFTAVRNAMAMWERGTCIHFIRNDDVGFLNNNWARFTMSNNRGAFSKFVGYEVPADILDDTKMGITMWNQYISTSVAAHELGHLIGLYHTNARSDRNTYVKYGFKQCLNDYISGTNAGACAVNELTWQNDLCNNVNARDTLMNHADEWKRISLKDGYDHTKRADRELCAKTLCAKAWQYQYFMRQEDKFPVTYDYGSIMHYSLDGCLQGKTVYPATYDPNVPSKQPGYLGAPTEHDFATVNHEYGCIQVQVTYNGNSANFFLHPTDVIAKLKVKFMNRFALAPATIGPLVVRVVATATEVAVNFPHGHIANQAYNGITLGTGRGERVVLA